MCVSGNYKAAKKIDFSVYKFEQGCAKAVQDSNGDAGTFGPLQCLDILSVFLPRMFHERS